MKPDLSREELEDLIARANRAILTMQEALQEIKIKAPSPWANIAGLAEESAMMILFLK